MVRKENTQHGKVVIFSAPSGAGKTTIVKYLLQQIPLLEFSVSACSRVPRPYEQDGKDYYFLTPEMFKKSITEDAFLEWEEVYEGQYYGTLHSEVERIWAAGHHVIFDVDVVGGVNLKHKLGQRALAVFVMPPSLDELKRRLQLRSTEDEASIQKRLAKATRELTYAEKFDHILINDHLEKALEEAEKTVRRFLALTPVR